MLDRLYGSGRAQRLGAARLAEQVRHRALNLFTQVIDYEIDEPSLLDAEVQDIEVRSYSSMLTVYLAVADVEAAQDCVARVEARLRAELAQHLPRRRTPTVRLRLLPLPGEEVEQ